MKPFNFCALSLFWPAQPAFLNAADMALVTNIEARLLAPISTSLNRKGDMVSVRIVEPSSLRDAILEGEIREIRMGASSNQGAHVLFEFHTLHFHGAESSVSASVVRIANSRSQSGSDEDGLPVQIGYAGRRLLSINGRNDANSCPRGPVRLSTKGTTLSLGVGSEMVLCLGQRER